MNRRIRIRIGDVVATATLFEDLAPKTTEGLWSALPLEERTIQTRWSGDAWRTEQEHKLTVAEDGIENVADKLTPGDIIYFPNYINERYKIGIAYGDARWLNPFCMPLDVAHIGKIDEGLGEFVEASQRIIFDGPLNVTIERAE
ncbi:DUF3830 family protein [Glaciibacter superstes]|uniref:DUF3830 family protein n=1 Tax=Glaciibacter superstes TaxID=501023 RepID=UPI0003B4D635|nr:DUF3830 family protein [Glaciibacter superstes]